MERIAQGIERTYAILLKTLGTQGWWPLSWRRGEPGFDDLGYHPEISGIELSERDRFEISLGAILTQNTSWLNVELALSRLLEKGITTSKKLLSFQLDSLKEAIKPCGYYNQKAKKLVIACAYFEASGILRNNRAPRRSELLDLWGIGPETADSILLYAFGAPVFVIDAYTKRLFSRLGILEGETAYHDLQDAFLSRLPLDARLFNEYHALIVKFCKAYCSAKPSCGECPLKRRCRAHISAVKA
jgi:endonuclease-3 related protein